MEELQTDVVLGNRYRLLRRIAVGGMGSVWEAEDGVLHRRVAVKLLSDSLSSDRRFADRFRREAQAAAGLSHPNIASVFDYGEDADRRFMVMELVDGEPLSERLTGPGGVAPSEAVRIAAQVALGLQAAHEAGIVHRDIKPGNVMLTDAGQVKVLDFGIAAAAGAPLTATGARMGTATYLSPEQAMGEPPTPGSDVYSLGVVLYEMLAGRPPFTSDTPVGVAAQHVQREPPPLDGTARGIPPPVAAACLQALAKDPARRPPSAAAFASMLLSANGDGGAAPSAGAVDPEDRTTLVLPPLESTARLEAPPMAPAPRRARRSLVPWAVAAMLVAAGALGLAVFLSTRDGGKAPATSNQVTVPDVSGMRRGDAEQQLRDQGFQIGDHVQVEGEPGVVVRTDPPAGAQVAPGTTVTLYVGAAPHEGDHDNGKGKGHGGDD